MVCSCFDRLCCALSIFRSRNELDMDDEKKKVLERKLYLARETPEPVFDLSDCDLREIPKGIFSICKVFHKDKLVLDSNKLRSLDHGGDLTELSSLTVLNIKSNLFNQLPRDIKFLINLKELYLDNNKLTYLPEELCELINLNILSVSNNDLNELPKNISKMLSLQYLNLKNNPLLTTLPEDICLIKTLVEIELDSETVTVPPADVTSQSTKAILKYFCNLKCIEYIPPIKIDSTDNSCANKCQITKDSFFNKNCYEKYDDQQNKEQEVILHELAKQRRDSLLNKILEEQQHLESIIGTLHDEKEKDKLKLLKDIQNEEKIIGNIIKNVIKLSINNPQRHEQQIEFEISEKERLNKLFNDNINTKLNENTLKAMQQQMESEISHINTFNQYTEKLHHLKQSVLNKEAHISNKLSNILKTNECSKLELLQQLSRDEEMQKVAVASLLERTDSQTWSLNQEIAIIAENLSRLTHLEMDKKKIDMDYNLNTLSQQRIELMGVLQDLFKKQSLRQQQLYNILLDMESKQETMTNFWLVNYQKLLDTTPETMTNMAKNLDPAFANILLEENVIHCLPFLVKVIFSESLQDITDEKLNKIGLKLKVDRIGVLKAIERYLSGAEQPSAPLLDVADKLPSAPETKIENECAICMDKSCEIVFLPCAHMCCCSDCALKDINACPICRVDIEKKIKIIAC